jgi:methionyl-tRNA formyltransferase
MRVVFLGNAAWSVPPLEAVVASSHEVRLVLTRVPRPAGRGNVLTPTPVAHAAARLGTVLEEIETIRSGRGLEALANAEPDVLVVVAYGEIVPQAVLDVPRVAPVNLHFSLLPELRGAAPVQRALLEGMTATGVTTIRMDAGMDTGPILLQAGELIRSEDDAGSLGSRLARTGAGLLVDTLDRMEAGTIDERAQDGSRATYAPKITGRDRIIDWQAPEHAVIGRVRAMAPDPGAETSFRGRVLKVYRASETTDPEGGRSPGDIVLASKQGLAVATGGRPVALEEVQPEGRTRMSGGEFVRGYRPEAGERLG